MSKFLGALKIAGLSFLLCCGTACEAIGIPLIFVGQSKADKALESFTNSAEYQVMRQTEDERLSMVEDRIEEIEAKYNCGELSIVEYNYLKNAYEEDIKNSEESFVEQSFEKYATDEQRAMVKSGDAMQIAGGVLAGLGGLELLFRGYSFVSGSIQLEEPSEVIGEDIVEKILDVVYEDFDIEERRKKRAERKKAKEDKKERPFVDDEEEELGNIEDSCYSD